MAQQVAERRIFRSAAGVRVVRLKHPGWWVGSTAVVAFLAGFVHLLATNQNIRWDVIWYFLWDPEILRGLWMTMKLTVIAMVLGLLLGVVLAIMRLSGNPLFRAVSWLWIWFFRGVPPLVQMIFWFNLATLLPTMEVGIPIIGPTFAVYDTNTLISSFSAAILGLAFTESAYAAEMLRAGIMAVPKGQTEAARTLGMNEALVLRRIVLPQALKIVIPPIGNDFISMLKFTSLVSVLATPDLLYTAQMIYSRNYQTIPLLLVATIWYLVLTTIFTIIQQRIEQRAHRVPGQTISTRGLRFLPSRRSQGPHS